MEEKRKYIRVPLVVKVTNRATKEFHYFYSRDISLGGIYLETRDPYPIGTEVELDFFINLRERKERLVVAARIARVLLYDIKALDDTQTPGMGVEFVSPDAAILALVGNFIKEVLGESD